MATATLRTGNADEMPNIESARSGISWGAIIGGGVAATALSLILVAVGVGLGFSAVSPWANAGASAAAVGAGAGVWFLIVQWLSSAMGGYVAGRLRTKWAAHGTDEVFFRDTAHGFLAWAIATLLTVWLIASAAGGLASITGTVAAGAAQGGTQNAAQGVSSSGAMDTALDQLFRPSAPAAPAAGAPAPAASNGDVRAESGRILLSGITGTIAPEDKTYLGQVIASRTGLSQADAEARIDQVTTKAKSAADTARKAAATAAILTAISLLIGAFIAAVSGALGGRHRDLI